MTGTECYVTVTVQRYIHKPSGETIDMVSELNIPKSKLDAMTDKERCALYRDRGLCPLEHD